MNQICLYNFSWAYISIMLSHSFCTVIYVSILLFWNLIYNDVSMLKVMNLSRFKPK